MGDQARMGRNGPSCIRQDGCSWIHCLNNLPSNIHVIHFLSFYVLFASFIIVNNCQSHESSSLEHQMICHPFRSSTRHPYITVQHYSMSGSDMNVVASLVMSTCHRHAAG